MSAWSILGGRLRFSRQPSELCRPGFFLAIAVTEVDARHTLGARAQQLWQELHAQLDTLKTLERDLIVALGAYRLLGRPPGA